MANYQDILWVFLTLYSKILETCIVLKCLKYTLVMPHYNERVLTNISSYKLFILMIGDIMINNVNIHKYMDNTTITEKITSINDSKLQKATGYALQWSQLNKMNTNQKKTKVMNILFKQKLEFPKVRIENVTIKEVNQFKLLGIYITSDSHCDVHVNKITKKVSNRINF